MSENATDAPLAVRARNDSLDDASTRRRREAIPKRSADTTATGRHEPPGDRRSIATCPGFELGVRAQTRTPPVSRKATKGKRNACSEGFGLSAAIVRPRK